MIFDKDAWIVLVWFPGVEIIPFLYFWWKAEAKLKLIDFITFGSLGSIVLMSVALCHLGSEGDVSKILEINLAIFGFLGLLGVGTFFWVNGLKDQRLSKFLATESAQFNSRGKQWILLFTRNILLFSIFAPSIWWILSSEKSDWLLNIVVIFSIAGNYLLFKRYWK